MNVESRPRYFTEKNLIEENAIAAVVSEIWHCHLERLSEWAYRLDYAITELPGWRSPVLGFMEIKDRPNVAVGQNSGYQIAAHKLAFARILTTGTKLKALLGVRVCTGEIYVTDLLKYPPSKVILSVAVIATRLATSNRWRSCRGKTGVSFDRITHETYPQKFAANENG